MAVGRAHGDDGSGDGAEEGGRVTRLYTNHLALEFSLSEVELRFGQVSGPECRLVLHSRLVTSPVHLVGFGRAIALTIGRYEGRFGPIPDPAAEPAPDERQG